MKKTGGRALENNTILADKRTGKWEDRLRKTPCIQNKKEKTCTKEGEKQLEDKSRFNWNIEEVHLFLHSTNIYCTEYLYCKDSVLGTWDKTMKKRDKTLSSFRAYILAELYKVRRETQEERYYQRDNIRHFPREEKQFPD